MIKSQIPKLRGITVTAIRNLSIIQFSNLQIFKSSIPTLRDQTVTTRQNLSILQFFNLPDRQPTTDNREPTTDNREQNKSVSCSPNTLLALCFLIPWRLRFFYRRFLPCIGGCAPNRWPSKIPFYCSQAMCFMPAGIGDFSSCCCSLRFWIISRACKYTKPKALPKNGFGSGLV